MSRRIIRYVNLVVFSLITLLAIGVMALLFAGLVSQKGEAEVAIVVNGYPVTTTEVLDMKAMIAANAAINRSANEDIMRWAGEEYGKMAGQDFALSIKYGIDV